MNKLIGLLLRLFHCCIYLLVLLVWAQDHVLALDSTPSLTMAGNKIVAELEHKDFVAFDREVSSEGLLFVRREPDWSQSNVPLKDQPVNPGYLSFKGMKTVAWEEYEVPFAKPDLNNASYRSLLNQFRRLVLESRRDYHALTTSQDTEDGFWFYERRLGPAIFGKIASDECLYIYLKREGSQWKVWRMELWERGAPQPGR